MRAYHIFVLAVLLIGSVIVAPAVAGTSAGDSFTAMVIGVVDGDTLVVEKMDESRLAIHLEGVTAEGKDAKKFLKEVALKQEAEVMITGRDGGKILANVKVDGKDLGATLADAGFAGDSETRKAR